MVVSSGSSVIANSAIVVFGTLRFNTKVVPDFLVFILVWLSVRIFPAFMVIVNAPGNPLARQIL